MQTNLPAAGSSSLFDQEFSRHLTPRYEAAGMTQVATEPRCDEEANQQFGMGFPGHQAPGSEEPAIAQCPVGHAGALLTDTERVSVTGLISGRLIAVDTAAGMIIITDRNGERLALGVVSDTRILVNGSSVDIAELPNQIGARVDAMFGSDGRLTLNITVDGQSAD